jgi:hypothetical protein
MNRRELLAAGVSAALLARAPALARGSGDQALRAALDGLGNATPAAKLDRLKAFSPATLTLSSALDLLTVRSGLAIDAQLMQRFLAGCRCDRGEDRCGHRRNRSGGGGRRHLAPTAPAKDDRRDPRRQRVTNQ